MSSRGRGRKGIKTERNSVFRHELYNAISYGYPRIIHIGKQRIQAFPIKLIPVGVSEDMAKTKVFLEGIRKFIW
ncbi:MAG: hypothetical protein J6S91_03745 [Treponema sp.]|nr:hypothetical protein [Treponema sp.]